MDLRTHNPLPKKLNNASDCFHYTPPKSSQYFQVVRYILLSHFDSACNASIIIHTCHVFDSRKRFSHNYASINLPRFLILKNVRIWLVDR